MGKARPLLEVLGLSVEHLSFISIITCILYRKHYGSVFIQEVDFLKYVPVLKNLEARYIRGDKFLLRIDTPKLRVVIVRLINPFNRSLFKINYILIPTYLS